MIYALAGAFAVGLAVGRWLTLAWVGADRQAQAARVTAAVTAQGEAEHDRDRWKAIAAAATNRADAEGRATAVAEAGAHEALTRLSERVGKGDGFSLLTAEQKDRKP